MKIAVPKEIKNHEYRVGLVPSSVHLLKDKGHSILVETDAGAAIGFSDKDYEAAGALIAKNSDEIYEYGEMIVKVKEPQLEECSKLRENQLLFAYLHLAAVPQIADGLLHSGCIAIAYETVTDNEGRLPLLTPMSEVAGRLSIQAGAHCLEKSSGGRGILLGGVPGVEPGNVVIIGGGSAGTEAIRVALGIGARVYVIEKSLPRLQELSLLFQGKINTIYSTPDALEQHLATADLVVGAVLIPGAAAPKLVSREMLRKMRPGSVIVDISIDQGGCFETSQPTTHSNPTYIAENVLHYCVTNMPAVVPLTSTLAFNNATLSFVLALADEGYRKACQRDPNLMHGLTVYRGKITHPEVAKALKMTYWDPKELLE